MGDLRGLAEGFLGARRVEELDFALTDPPYLIDYRARDGRRVANDDNSQWLRPAFVQIYRVLKPASFCVSFYAWNRIHQFMTAWRAVGSPSG